MFAEGCRGSLGRRLEARFALRGSADPQHFGFGLKEIWQIDPAKHAEGEVVHTVGWPLDDATDGGGFLYHAAARQVYSGSSSRLSYANPHLDPYAEFQRWKEHPRIRDVLAGGERISYGARAVNKGGLQSLPERCSVPGGLLVGCEAGFLNPAKIKGSHTAMKSGMLAAESIHAALRCASQSEADAELARLRGPRARFVDLERAARGAQLSRRASRSSVPRLGGALAFVEQNLLRGRVPYTLRNRTPDHALLRRAADAREDRLSEARRRRVVRSPRSPCSCRARRTTRTSPCISSSRIRACRSRRICRGSTSPRSVIARPASTRSSSAAAGEPQFRINAANCVHCKTCDIKDPAQNITWVPPEGGAGPELLRNVAAPADRGVLRRRARPRRRREVRLVEVARASRAASRA